MKSPVLIAALLPVLASANSHPNPRGHAEMSKPLLPPVIRNLQPGGKKPLDFQVRVETVLKHDDGRFLWYHPRVAALPGSGKDGKPAVLMTLQKHLRVSDHYSGLHVMRTDDLGASWTGPEARQELDWRDGGPGVSVAVCDVTPGWHPRSRKLLAIGAQVRYSPQGEQLEDQPRANQTAYAVFDPKT
jgi:hypothetical protein